jgi:hypothetical protein
MQVVDVPVRVERSQLEARRSERPPLRAGGRRGSLDEFADRKDKGHGLGIYPNSPNSPRATHG